MGEHESHHLVSESGSRFVRLLLRHVTHDWSLRTAPATIRPLPTRLSIPQISPKPDDPEVGAHCRQKGRASPHMLSLHGLWCDCRPVYPAKSILSLGSLLVAPTSFRDGCVFRESRYRRSIIRRSDGCGHEPSPSIR